MLVKRYSPLELVVVVIFWLVAKFTASTVALGTTAPEASLTLPVRSPLVACASRRTGTLVTMATTASTKANEKANFVRSFVWIIFGFSPHFRKKVTRKEVHDWYQMRSYA